MNNQASKRVSSRRAPKVSIAILTYNHGPYIEQCVRSALNQRTDFFYEIVIGDDFSDDATRSNLTRLQREYPDQIVLNLQPRRPGGLPGRVNNMTNLAACRGEYIAILDGDDYWVDTAKLQMQVDFLDANPAYSGTAHDSLLLDQATGTMRSTTHADRVGPVPDHPTDVVFSDFFGKNPFQTSTICFRRALIVPLPPWFDRVHSADRGIFMTLTQMGPIRFIPQALSVYRIHANSVMHGSVHQSRLSFARWQIVDWDIFLASFPAARTRLNLAVAEKVRAQVAFADRRYFAAIQHAMAMLRHHPARFAKAIYQSVFPSVHK